MYESRVDKALKYIVAGIFIFLMILALSHLDGNRDSALETNRTPSGQYIVQETKINGMNCIVLKNETYYGYIVESIDCDWRSK